MRVKGVREERRDGVGFPPPPGARMSSAVGLMGLTREEDVERGKMAARAEQASTRCATTASRKHTRTRRHMTPTAVFYFTVAGSRVKTEKKESSG